MPTERLYKLEKPKNPSLKYGKKNRRRKNGLRGKRG